MFLYFLLMKYVPRHGLEKKNWFADKDTIVNILVLSHILGLSCLNLILRRKGLLDDSDASVPTFT
jgi:hypothetical protein